MRHVLLAIRRKTRGKLGITYEPLYEDTQCTVPGMRWTGHVSVLFIWPASINSVDTLFNPSLLHILTAQSLLFHLKVRKGEEHQEKH